MSHAGAQPTWKLTALAVLFLAAGLHLSAQGAPYIPKDHPLAQKPSGLLAGVNAATTYSGFRHGQHPDRGNGEINPTEAQFLEDLRLLSRDKDCGMMRLYDSQENAKIVLKLIRREKLPMKVLLGAWLTAEVHNPNCPWLTAPIPQATLDANKLENQKELARCIALAKEYADIVVAVNVGNECQVEWNDHLVPEESLIGYIRAVKKAIKQPVTTSDNYDWWAKRGARVAKEVDFVAVHTYPEWENKSIDEAVPFTIANMQAVRNAMPNSQLVITEAGWATVSYEFGPRASEENQKRYINELLKWSKSVNITCFIFEAFDEDWKGDPNNPMAAEKHWGVFTIDRKPKLVMQEKFADLIPVKAK